MKKKFIKITALASILWLIFNSNVIYAEQENGQDESVVLQDSTESVELDRYIEVLIDPDHNIYD